MATKEELRRLVDELPEGEVYAALRYLEYLRDKGDPVFYSLEAAPLDDETETPAEKRAVQDARRALTRGETVSDEELRRELDL